MPLTSKLPDVGTTIFTVMSRMAMEAGAINLSQGFPDFDPDPALIERVHHYLTTGRNQYAPMEGLPVLRERIADKISATYAATYDPETEITITAGATEALYAAIAAVVQPGDEVILLEPAYDAYEPVIRLNGGIPVYVRLTPPTFAIDWDLVRNRITDRTRLLIVNSPHNPSGTIMNGDDLAALEALAEQHAFWILSDEVYEHIVFDGHRHESMTRSPLLASRSFVVSSFGKTFHTTGWKIGYCLAPKALSKEFRKIHQFLTFAVNTPIQFAYADFLENPAPYRELPDFYQRKRDLFRNALTDSRFNLLPCQGTYFQMADYSAISDLPDMEFARWITQTHKVAVIPPSVFYHDGFDNRVVRFCFAKNDDTLTEAAKILCQI